MNKLLLNIFLTSILSLFLVERGIAQDDLMSMLEEETTDSAEKTYTFATFKSPRIINGHSVETPSKNELLFIISHRFGTLNGGTYELFGLDKATIRFGLEYSPLDWFCFGVGRSTYKKNYDSFVKTRLLRQSKGAKSSPITLVLVSTMSINSLKWQDPSRNNLFTSRMSYTHQILIARKFNSKLSLQAMPTVVHKNMVAELTDANDIYAMGFGGRIKLSTRFAITAEYYYLLNPTAQIPLAGGNKPYNSLSIGVDIETGGHVFQFQLSNSQSMFNSGFITETTSTWANGGIHLGFNITRPFALGKKK